MKENHIISILESKPFSSFNEQELHVIQMHVDTCLTCRQAYQVAEISALLLKERTAQSFSPSPFFKTRVLALWRERESENKGRVLVKLWRSAGALVSSMAATVAMLAMLSFVGPEVTLSPEVANSSANAYSAEDLYFNQSQLSEDQVSDSQIYSTLYEGEEEAMK
ncbi:MAG TPA: hypothetical protein VJ124_16300 [Pyrinomonadaceae bacterium]|nr:hypothetical protein [Pyrinomonadaceae bacterium]